MCPFVGVVVGLVGRVQDRKCLGTTCVPTGQKFRHKDTNSAIRQAQKQAVTEFRTPGVQSDRNSAFQASGTPEKPKIRNQQHNPQVYPPYTPSQCYSKYAFTALATTAPEYMGCYGPAEAEHHVAFSWRDICRRSHMGAQLNPTSITLVAALDYPSATKMDVAENRAHTAVLPSVAYHGGGGVPATRLTLGSTAHQARFGWGGLVHLHAASRHRAHHSTVRRAPCP